MAFGILVIDTLSTRADISLLLAREYLTYSPTSSTRKLLGSRKALNILFGTPYSAAIGSSYILIVPP